MVVVVGCGGPPRSAEPSPDAGGAPAARTLGVGREHALPGATAMFHATASGFAVAQRSHEIAIDRRAAQLTPIALAQHGAPLALATTALVAGVRDAAADAPSIAAAAGGGVTIDRGPFREAWTDTQRAAEVSWTLAARPAPGAITITVAATGEAFVAQTATGLHFADAQGLGFRVGDAIFVDANGAEWAVPATWNGAAITYVVPAAAAAAAAYPATLDPTISPESAVDTPIASTTGANTSNPAVAFDGTNYLVVWADARDGRDTDIWGVRVDQAGAILDPDGIKIAATPGVQSSPTVAFDGTRYVVAWADFKVSGGTEADIAAATVSTAGAVTALPAVASTPASETTPAIAANGSGALVTWVASGQIMGAMWTGSFGAPFAVTSGTNAHKDPAVAANPAGDYLVVFTETTAATSDDARGQLVTAAGALNGAAFDISAGKGLQSNATASFDGTNFDVAWSNNYNGVDIYGTRVTTAGAALDTHLEGTTTVGGKVLDNAAGSQTAPSLACTAAGCLLTWSDTRTSTTTASDVYGEVVTTAFAVSGADFAIANPAFSQAQVRVAAGGSAYFAAWQDLRSNNAATITGARVSGGAVQDPGGIVLVAGWNGQVGPTSARSGTTLAVGWGDSRSGDGGDVEMVRIGATGVPVDPAAIDVSPAALAQFSPASAGFGSNLVYAWTDTRNGIDKDIYAARVSTSGTLVDPNGIAITTATKDQLTPDVASSGSEALVVWSDRGSGNFDIMGAVLGAGGTVTVPPFVICNATGDQTAPAVTYDAADAQYIVAWVDARTGGRDLYAARVTAAGAVLDANGVGVVVGGTRLNPRLAVNGSLILVVYEDRASGKDIYGARLTAGASLGVLDPSGFPIANDPSDQVTPTVASVTAGFLVAWTDSRSLATSGTDIWAQIVGTGGLVGSNFVVSADLENESAPSATDASATGVLLSYQKQRTDLDAARVVTRMIDSTPSLVSIAVTPGNPTIAKGLTQAFTATGTYSDASTQNLTASVTWGSTATAVATIDATGLATAVGTGTTTISATLGAVSGSTTLSVGPPALVSIAVTPANPTIAKGLTQPFTATGTYTDLSTQNLTASVTWGSTATAVATIDATGLATAVGTGTTTISATLGAVSGSTTLTVGPATLVSIGVSPTFPQIAKGTSQQFTATGTYTDGSTQDLTASMTWGSSSTSVATIVAGKAQGVGAGTTTITATSGALSDSTTLTVTAATLTSIAVTPVDPTIAKGTTVQFSAIGTYSDGSTQDLTTQVTWSSSSTATASITAGGFATGVGAGTSTIKAQRGSASDTSVLTVTAATLSSIAVTPTTATIAKGTTQQYTAIGTYSDTSTQDITALVAWSSGTTTVATIAAGGLATGAGAGTSTISASLSGVNSNNATLTVTAATVVSIAITPANPSVAIGYKLQLHATATFSDTTTQDVTSLAIWSSSKSSVVSVSNAAGSKGLVSAKAAGAATITATFGGKSGTTSVTASAATLSSIAITPSPLTLAVKAQQQLTATGTFSDGTTIDVTAQVSWKSGAKKTASVTGQGVAKGVKAGTTSITASKGTVVGTVPVTVN
jgi:hypothetical protein